MVGGSQVERLMPPAPIETEWSRLVLSQATCCVFFAGISVVNSFVRLLCQIGALFKDYCTMEIINCILDGGENQNQLLCVNGEIYGMLNDRSMKACG